MLYGHSSMAVAETKAIDIRQRDGGQIEVTNVEKHTPTKDRAAMPMRLRGAYYPTV